MINIKPFYEFIILERYKVVKITFSILHFVALSFYNVIKYFMQ